MSSKCKRAPWMYNINNYWGQSFICFVFVFNKEHRIRHFTRLICSSFWRLENQVQNLSLKLSLTVLKDFVEILFCSSNVKITGLLENDLHYQLWDSGIYMHKLGMRWLFLEELYKHWLHYQYVTYSLMMSLSDIITGEWRLLKYHTTWNNLCCTIYGLHASYFSCSNNYIIIKQ